MPDIISIIAILISTAIGLSIAFVQLFTGVPPVSTNASQANDAVALLKEAGLPEHAVIYDLGCGWGDLVIAFARAFPNAKVRGIEISPFPYWIARLRTCNMSNVSLLHKDFNKCYLRDAHAVACYLMPNLIPKLANFLDREIKQGTRVVALTFWFHERQVTLARKNLIQGVALYYWPAL